MQEEEETRRPSWFWVKPASPQTSPSPLFGHVHSSFTVNTVQLDCGTEESSGIPALWLDHAAASVPGVTSLAMNRNVSQWAPSTENFPSGRLPSDKSRRQLGGWVRLIRIQSPVRRRMLFTDTEHMFPIIQGTADQYWTIDIWCQIARLLWRRWEANPDVKRTATSKCFRLGKWQKTVHWQLIVFDQTINERCDILLVG